MPSRRPTTQPLGLHLTRTARAVSQAFDRAMAEAGGSAATWQVLLLVRSGDWSTQSQLAKATIAPWEDTKPPAQLQVAAEPNQAPKTARAQRPMERAVADNLAYKQAVKEYLEDIVRASTKHVVYPDSARKSHWTGTTSIWFRLTSGGELGESFVDTSSGYATLDVAALLAVRKAITDLQAPQLIRDRGMMATVAVTFALADKAIGSDK